uniref:Uncharacterized protein n=1 Tax=Cucumis melo TaxID=3656 RepID=A0A9I9E8C3_CUCME
MSVRANFGAPRLISQDNPSTLLHLGIKLLLRNALQCEPDNHHIRTQDPATKKEDRTVQILPLNSLNNHSKLVNHRDNASYTLLTILLMKERVSSKNSSLNYTVYYLKCYNFLKT